MERSMTMIAYVLLGMIGAGLLVVYVINSLGPVRPPSINITDDNRGVIVSPPTPTCDAAGCVTSDSNINDCSMPSCVDGSCVADAKARPAGYSCLTADGKVGDCDASGVCVERVVPSGPTAPAVRYIRVDRHPLALDTGINYGTQSCSGGGKDPAGKCPYNPETGGVCDNLGGSPSTVVYSEHGVLVTSELVRMCPPPQKGNWVGARMFSLADPLHPVIAAAAGDIDTSNYVDADYGSALRAVSTAFSPDGRFGVICDSSQAKRCWLSTDGIIAAASSPLQSLSSGYIEVLQDGGASVLAHATGMSSLPDDVMLTAPAPTLGAGPKSVLGANVFYVAGDGAAPRQLQAFFIQENAPLASVSLPDGLVGTLAIETIPSGPDAVVLVKGVDSASRTRIIIYEYTASSRTLVNITPVVLLPSGERSSSITALDGVPVVVGLHPADDRYDALSGYFVDELARGEIRDAMLNPALVEGMVSPTQLPVYTTPTDGYVYLFSTRMPEDSMVRINTGTRAQPVYVTRLITTDHGAPEVWALSIIE